MLWFDIADKLLPPVYRAIKDMYAYAKALNDEFLVYVNFMERILKNFFIQTCDLQTVEYWENLLGLTVTEGETIEERKQEILEHLNNQHAITEPYVREQIERFFPGNEYRLYFEDGKPYDLNIDIFSEDIDAYRQALAIFWPWLNKMIPAHLKTTMARAIDTEFDRPVVISHGHYTALLADIGLVERIVPERMVIGGTVGLESLVGEDFEIDPHVSLRGGIIDLSGNLQAESPSPQGAVEGGEIDLTGNLRTESPSPQGSVISDPYAIIAYKADGTTSPGIFNPAGGTYQVDAVDSAFHTAADLEALGWYVKWRVYSKTNPNGINIRDSYGTSGTTVISVWYSGSPVVNPNLHGPEGYENWMQAKFSTDNGATIQNGWINMGATGYGISYVEQAVNKDYFLV